MPGVHIGHDLVSPLKTAERNTPRSDYKVYSRNVLREEY